MVIVSIRIFNEHSWGFMSAGMFGAQPLTMFDDHGYGLCYIFSLETLWIMT
jgi:hypothetical protein